MKYLGSIALFFVFLPILAFGQVAAPLRLQELDKFPSVLSPTVINVPNGSLVCTGHNCTLTFGSGSGTVTSVSVTTANGVSGSVANATTTPAITLTLGAITPTSVVTSSLTVDPDNAATATVVNVASFGVNSTGTAAAGFGGLNTFTGESSTTNDTLMASEKWYWNVATHASRGSVLELNTVSNATTSNRMAIAPRKTLTDNSAISLFEVAVASGSAVGGTINATIISSDGTDFQERHVIVNYGAVNKAGTLTSSITVVSESANVSTGTLTGTWSVLNGSSKITIQLNADSSLTPTTHFVMYRVQNNSEQVVTIL